MNWLAFKEKIENELHNEILPFWIKNMKDPEGGLYGHISNDHEINCEADQGLVMVSRLLWTYAESYRTSGREEYLHFARELRECLQSRFWDSEHKGFYWIVSKNGRAVDKKKVLYGQAFALYGLSTYQMIDPGTANGILCRNIFDLLESHGRDFQYGGYYEALNRDWTYGGTNNLGADDRACDKSMNTNLHLLEAYSRYFMQSGNTKVKKSLAELIEVICTRIYNQKTGHQNLYFTKDWTALGNIDSYGHDVEASWLIWEALETLGDDTIKNRYRETVLKLLEVSCAEATAPDGSLYNELEKGHLDKTRIWWVQAEYAVSLMNGWMMTGKNEFREKLFHLWDYIEKNQKDTRFGEWFWGINEDGTVLGKEKGGMWKTPYHNGRACMELIHRIDTVMEREQYV